VPVVEQVAQRGGGGQRQPAADAGAGGDELDGGVEADAEDRQVAPRRPGAVLGVDVAALPRSRH
jgi:hypothetical protein